MVKAPVQVTSQKSLEFSDKKAAVKMRGGGSRALALQSRCVRHKFNPAITWQYYAA
jgi:hypothetical protein